jgi:adenylate cyclase class 2
MIEIEVKLKIEDSIGIEKCLLDQRFILNEILKETDIYFDGGINGIKKSGQALRVRRTVDCATGKEHSMVTFKGEKLDRVSMTRLELDTGVESSSVEDMLSDLDEW